MPATTVSQSGKCAVCYLLHEMTEEATCSVCKVPSALGTAVRNTKRALVLFFLECVAPIRNSTSAFRSFRMPTQSMLEEKNRYIRDCHNISIHLPSASEHHDAWPVCLCDTRDVFSYTLWAPQMSFRMDVNLLTECSWRWICKSSCVRS